VGVVLFKKPLTASFVPSDPLLISGNEITLGFEIVVTTAPAGIEWYLEFSESPAGPWYREIAEEDIGLGVVRTPTVVRTFMDNGAATLAIGTHRLDAELRRRRQIARVQLRLAAGGPATATVNAPFGKIAA
jgi:hypothetical protein